MYRPLRSWERTRILSLTIRSPLLLYSLISLFLFIGAFARPTVRPGVVKPPACMSQAACLNLYNQQLYLCPVFPAPCTIYGLLPSSHHRPMVCSHCNAAYIILFSILYSLTTHCILLVSVVLSRPFTHCYNLFPSMRGEHIGLFEYPVIL